MLKDITLGQYVPGTSPVHRLDPRTKILGVTAFVVLLFLAHGLMGYLVVTAFSVLVVALSSIPISYLLRGLRPLLFLLVLTMVLQVFLTPGTPIWHWGPLVATREGLTQGIFLSYRLVLLVFVTSLLTLTTSPIALTDGLERLLQPFKRLGLPAHELAMMMTIALRFIPTLLEEADKIMKAQMARGADFESGNPLQRARGLVPLLVPLFVGAFRRADELAMAMEARCYRGGEGRTRLKQLRFTGVDAGALVLVALLTASVVWLRFLPAPGWLGVLGG
ncbi:MAG: energy-coupling factor transporter transmembrane protein EcfT [Firmicutes bacterium]|nr:energy-coupling factor transporter transmembrane protein EcfT [Bacillota bacterium]